MVLALSECRFESPTLRHSFIISNLQIVLPQMLPDLVGLNPEDYPDINKLGILADIAPYSREYNRIRAVVDKQANGNPELRAHYEQIVDQVRQTKESTLQVDKSRFDAPVDKIKGPIKSASFHGVELSEYPGRVFHFSAVGSSMADLVADQLGKSNSMTRPA